MTCSSIELINWCKADRRKYFALSKFGFYNGGTLQISVNKLSLIPDDKYHEVGFSLTKTLSDSISPNLESYQENCFLEDKSSSSVLYLIFDIEKQRLKARCTGDLNSLLLKAHSISSEKSGDDALSRDRRNAEDLISDTSLLFRRKRADVQPTNKSLQNPDTKEKPKQIVPSLCEQWNIPLTVQDGDVKSYSVDITITIPNDGLQGLYSLYFHNCGSSKIRKSSTISSAVNLSLSITENNNGNYLSAGEMPLPMLYFCMAVIFFTVGCVWFGVIRKYREDAFKIHYLMGLLVFVKSFSLLFHGINYFYIEKDGSHIEAWAVLYYITHLLKGALLFITIVLIGTGWAFIKHILSDKDKKIFMIVIPLQVLANVAEIIMAESEEGELQHTTWREIFIMVDLLCCGAILLPVVWSIRHLQEASQTDGKAAISLLKLKLFRHFYIMIVCYIYFTRIIIYLLRITVPFQWEWLDELFREIATFGFFVLTGYKFQPASNNPYFLVSQEDNDDLEMDSVITESGFMENISKVNQRQGEVESIEKNETITTKRESSHEYD
ncbi:Protein GPR107 [Nymphon striatum]|nr:Protein GPR107 [Nymphon striatum]